MISSSTDAGVPCIQCVSTKETVTPSSEKSSYAVAFSHKREYSDSEFTETTVTVLEAGDNQLEQVGLLNALGKKRTRMANNQIAIQLCN